MELWQYDATDLARLIRTGQASAREAVDSVLARLHKVNPAINAVVRVLEEESRAAAETADAASADIAAHAINMLNLFVLISRAPYASRHTSVLPRIRHI